MDFLFVGVNFKYADSEAISTNVDQFLKVLKNDREYRENSCRISARYTQFKSEDFSIETTNLSVYVGAKNALNYLVFFKDKLIGYSNIDFLYTGLMFKTSNIRSQKILNELEFFFEDQVPIQYFRKGRQVGVAEWFDHVLKADAYQVSEYYSLRLKSTMHIRYKPIASEDKESAYEWVIENNSKALGEDVLEVLELLNSITTIIFYYNS